MHYPLQPLEQNLWVRMSVYRFKKLPLVILINSECHNALCGEPSRLCTLEWIRSFEKGHSRQLHLVGDGLLVVLWLMVPNKTVTSWPMWPSQP